MDLLAILALLTLVISLVAKALKNDFERKPLLLVTILVIGACTLAYLGLEFLTESRALWLRIQQACSGNNFS